MEQIPNNIISLIGSYLYDEDIKSSLLTSPIFSDIGESKKYHEILIFNDNLKIKLTNLNKIINYVYKIKPRLNKLLIKFYDIIDIKDILRIELLNINCNIITLVFNSCTDQSILDISKLFPNNVKIFIREKYINGNEEFLNLQNLETLSTNLSLNNEHILNIKRICSIPNLFFSIKSGINILDLSLIDINKNRNLTIFTSEEIYFTNPYKITSLILEPKDRNLYQFLSLIQSIDEDDNFENSRLTNIYLNDKNIYLNDKIILKNDYIKKIPLHVNFNVCINNIEDITLIDRLKENNIENINYMYNDYNSYIHALMFKKIYHDLNIVKHPFTNNINEPNIITIDHIYNEMSAIDRKKWYLPYKLFKKYNL